VISTRTCSSFSELNL